MSKPAFQVFNMAYGIGAELLYAACLMLFLRPSLAGRGRIWRLALILGFCLLSTSLCNNPAVPAGTSGLLLTGLLTLSAGVLGLERSRAFLLALLYWNAKTSSGLIVESPDFLLDRLRPAPMEPPEAVYLRAAVLVTLFLLANIALLAGMLYALHRQLRRRKLSLRGWELCYLSLIPAAGVLSGQIISRLWLEMKDGEFLLLYERHPAFLAAVPVLALLFYAGAYLAVVFQQRMASLREEQANHYVEYRQIQAIRSRIGEAERFYEHIRRLEHEMRNHLTAIKGLARRGAYAELEDYIAKVDGSVGGPDPELATGNPVTDVIIGDIRRRCRDAGIRFQAEFRCPETGIYDVFDLGIILQNLLQNAAEACEKVKEGERYIVLSGRRRGRFFLIEVRNSYAEEVVFGQDGLPVTTKREDAPMHGIGLSNVRREAEKYMGELELRAEGREFSAAVLLQERRPI